LACANNILLVDIPLHRRLSSIERWYWNVK
jgi:hypothetical protein